jgi:sec-independent protein translocase protein TatA
MNLFEPTHLIILGIVILVLFGPKKIPELMRGFGQGVGELKKGMEEGKRQLNAAMEAAETTPAPATEHKSVAAHPDAPATTQPQATHPTETPAHS